jgi:hypothetical protein
MKLMQGIYPRLDQRCPGDFHTAVVAKNIALNLNHLRLLTGLTNTDCIGVSFDLADGFTSSQGCSDKFSD